MVDHICSLKRELVEEKDEVQYLQNLNETVGFYGPKSRVTARGVHATQTRACQNEEPKTEKTEKWHGGTVPCGTAVPRGMVVPPAKILPPYFGG